MRRLNFLADEPWDELDDDDRTRVRWFGHPFGADVLGASLRELRPGAPGSWLHMHYGVEEMFFVLAGTPTVRTPTGRGAAFAWRCRVLPGRPGRAARLLEPDRRAGSADRHFLEAFPGYRCVSRAGRRLGSDAPPRTSRPYRRRRGNHRSLRSSDESVRRTRAYS